MEYKLLSEIEIIDCNPFEPENVHSVVCVGSEALYFPKLKSRAERSILFPIHRTAMMDDDILCLNILLSAMYPSLVKSDILAL